jgi:lipopolysaccharide/colanic/teichoic acid biosynthesis glycosyltransferase
MRQAGLALLVKRAVDVAAASIGLVAAAPVMAGVAVAIALTDGFPVVFRQPRPGKGGRIFTIVKFRTMRKESHGPDGRPLSDAERLTPVGRFVRAASLDELPQLWNVLRGEMSLVGPRPLLVAYLSRYTPEQARRHDVLPGITGWAQINGRNALTWDEKFALDTWYVDHWSPWLDARILAKTAWKVLRREGISAAGHATMPEFTGTEARAGCATDSDLLARDCG